MGGCGEQLLFASPGLYAAAVLLCAGGHGGVYGQLEEDCARDTLPQFNGFSWSCTEADNESEEVQSDTSRLLLGTKCRLMCKEEIEAETSCTKKGWSQVHSPKEPCVDAKPCYNMLNEKLMNGAWKCTDQMSKECLYPKRGSMCELLCDKGFHQFYHKSSICTQIGWKPPIESFRCISCPPPMKPVNGKWTCDMSSKTNQTSCFITCDQGFRTKGAFVTVCNQGGEYNPPMEEFQCEPIHPKREMVADYMSGIESLDDYTATPEKTFNYQDCPVLQSPDFGRFVCEGSSCRLVCNPGYKTPGVVSATCVNKHWCTQDFGIGCKAISDGE